METHTGRASGHDSSSEPREIDEIPDADEHDDISHTMGNMSLSSGNASAPADIPDIDDIPDMEEEDLEGEDDAAVVAPKKAVATTNSVIDAGCVSLFRIHWMYADHLKVNWSPQRATYFKCEHTMS